MRVAIVGCGQTGRRLCQDAQTMGYEAVACVDANQSQARAMAETTGAKPMTWEKLLGGSSVDAVAVAAPTSKQSPYVLDALNASIPVIMTGPLCTSAADAKAVVKAARTADAPIVIAQHDAEQRAISAILSQYEAGRVGNAGFVRVTRKSAPPTGVKNWYRDEALSGGVVSQELATDFAWITGILGAPTRVFAQRSRISKGDFFEYALVTLRFASGAIAQLVGSWALAEGQRATIEICGDAGMIQLDTDDRATTFQSRVTRDPASPGAAESGMYLHAWRALRNPTDMHALESHMLAVTVAEQALRSAASGRAIAVKQTKGAKA